MKQLIKTILQDLPPDANIKSEAMQDHIADRIVARLHGGGDIKKKYHNYLLIATRYYNLDPNEILHSRQQPGMDIKHAIRYKLVQEGYRPSHIALAEGINHAAVYNSIQIVEQKQGQIPNILSLFV